MTLSAFFVQLLNGLAGASSLFMVAAGLSLIFGVTRIVNFAHGSFFMLGVYIAYSAVDKLGASLGFWPALVLAALAVGALGALVEVLLLRRIYRAPELFQLLATFALVLVLKDAALWLWGPEDLLGPRAPGLGGAIDILGRRFPTYDLLLIVVGPLVLGALWLGLTRTRWGTLVRAATQDREMVGALGVNQAWLFTSVFALGAMLAGLGGALQLPREPASLNLDLLTIGDAFVVVVVGGMGSIPGAYLAALLIAEIKALCVGLGTVHCLGVDFSFSKLTLVAEFGVMAVVLVWRPWGLLGRAQAASRSTGAVAPPLRSASRPLLIAAALLLAALLLLPVLSASKPRPSSMAASCSARLAGRSGGSIAAVLRVGAWARPIRPQGRQTSTTAITRNSATSVSLEKLKSMPNHCTVPMPTHIALISAINSAATNAPGIEPMPPTTTTTNASPMLSRSRLSEAGSRGNCSAPPRPASSAPSANTLVNSRAWLTPSAATISRSCVAARTSVPQRVRVSSSHKAPSTSGPTTISSRS